MIQTIPYVSHPPNSYIKSHILISAGPRKDTLGKDTELGEDVAGTISGPYQTFFWLLDGTSDSTSLKISKYFHDENNDKIEELSHVFSSRLLAQQLGEYFQEHIERCFQEGKKLDEILIEAKLKILENWVDRLNNHLSPEEKGPIFEMIKKGFKPTCSTTILIGMLNHDGHLYSLRSGDSKILVFDNINGICHLKENTWFAQDPTDEYDRIAFRLYLGEEGNKLQIKTNDQNCKDEMVQNVDSAFIFTDGIGRITESQLKTFHPNLDMTEQVRKTIGMINQKTYDDKTLIVLKRINSTQ